MLEKSCFAIKREGPNFAAFKFGLPMKLKLQPEQVSIGPEPGYGTLEPITQSATESIVLKRNKRYISYPNDWHFFPACLRMLRARGCCQNPGIWPVPNKMGSPIGFCLGFWRAPPSAIGGEEERECSALWPSERRSQSLQNIRVENGAP
jgi:hypothetical protein